MHQLTWSHPELLSSKATPWRLQTRELVRIGHTTAKAIIGLVAGIGFLAIEGALVTGLWLHGVEPDVVSFLIGISILPLLWMARQIWRFTTRVLWAPPMGRLLHSEGLL